MCLRAGQVCSGLVEGPLIIQMDGRRRHQKTSTVDRGLEQQSSIPEFQPSEEIEFQPLVQRYITFYNSHGDGHPTGVWAFPFLVDQSNWRHKSLDLSIRASATAFTALEARNSQLMQKSIEIYGTAVQQHLRSISATKAQERDIYMNIATSMMLASYEGLSPAAAFNAFKSHLDGISEMFLLFPEAVQNDVSLNRLFFDIRAIVLYISLLSFQRSKLSFENFPQVSYLGGTLPEMEALIGITTDLLNNWTGILAGRENWPTTLDIGKVHDKVAELRELYHSETDSLSKRLVWNNKSGGYPYRNTYTALTIAYLEATEILLALLAGEHSRALPERIIESSSTSIIDAARYIGRRSTGCAYVWILFPLTMAALHGSPNHREEAQTLFQAWNIPTKAAAFSPMALHMIPHYYTRFNLWKEEHPATTVQTRITILPIAD
jgi:hypothetical protein